MLQHLSQICTGVSFSALTGAICGKQSWQLLATFLSMKSGSLRCTEAAERSFHRGRLFSV